MQLTYIDEDDRAAGLAGMMISLATMDALDSLVSASLDAEGPMLRFGDSYYLGMSPAVSPKAVWETTMRNLHVTASLVLRPYLSAAKTHLRQSAAAPCNTVALRRAQGAPRLHGSRNPRPTLKSLSIGRFRHQEPGRRSGRLRQGYREGPAPSAI